MNKYELDENAKSLNNKLYGELYLENSKIKFVGKNNVLYIDGNLKLTNSSFEFRGDNSIIYICQTADILTLDIKIYNNSTFYIGKETWINKGLKVVLSEQTNVFFGNESLISYDTCIRTGDPHLIYDCATHKRINQSKSIYVGDHVWIGQHVMLLKGAKIGSGTVIGAMSVVSGKKYNSNCIYAGNPIKKIKENIFFLRDNCHRFIDEDTKEYMYYKNDEYIYEKKSDNLLFDEIEQNLKKLNVDKKIKYLNDITNNMDKNRFTI